MASNTFNGAGTTMQIDVDLTGTTPDLKEIFPTNIEEAPGLIMDTYRRLKDGGFSTNRRAGFEPVFTLTFKYDNSEGINFILNNRYSIDNLNDVPFSIVDGLTGDTITFSATIDEFSVPREIDTETELAIPVKLNGAPTLTPAP
jgi:hypothetical protein